MFHGDVCGHVLPRDRPTLSVASSDGRRLAAETALCRVALRGSVNGGSRNGDDPTLRTVGVVLVGLSVVVVVANPGDLWTILLLGLVVTVIAGQVLDVQPAELLSRLQRATGPADGRYRDERTHADYRRDSDRRMHSDDGGQHSERPPNDGDPRTDSDRIERLHRQYRRGEIDETELERRLDELLSDGDDDQSDSHSDRDGDDGDQSDSHSGRDGDGDEEHDRERE